MAHIDVGTVKTNSGWAAVIKMAKDLIAGWMLQENLTGRITDLSQEKE